MITREEALRFLNERIENRNIIKHLLATEALMAGIYEALKARGGANLGGTKKEWMMAGLLHDGDYCDEVPPERQGVQVTEWLKEGGYKIPDNVAQAMAAHNSATGVVPESKMAWALFCGDSLTGLIVAAALVMPGRRLAEVSVENVLNRFKESRFARGTRREDIALCEEKLDLSLREFVGLGLKAMQAVAGDLGL